MANDRSPGRPRSVDPTGTEEGSARITIRLSPSMRTALQDIAAQQGVSMAEVIRRAAERSVHPAGCE